MKGWIMTRCFSVYAKLMNGLSLAGSQPHGERSTFRDSVGDTKDARRSANMWKYSIAKAR